MTIAGARPNFMKVAPFLNKIADFNTQKKTDTPPIQSLLVHTGQHYDENMSEIFFKELGIQCPDINLCVGSGSHAVQTAKILVSFESACEGEKPDWVVVVGDVNSTLACALVCSKIGIRIAHIEAGLRSFDRTMPEEINRIVTDALSNLLFTPSNDADNNLLHEGIPRDRIKLVGNIMIDALLENLQKARRSDILSQYHLEPLRFVYVTLHRPSNVDWNTNLLTIMNIMEHVAKDYPVIFPIHPRTRKMLCESGLFPRGIENKLLLLDPIGYHGSLCLTENARLILTDSGGLQEEATYFRTPCLTLRPNTERPITVTLGSNRLTNIERLQNDINEILNGPERIGQIPPLWDGKTAKRVLNDILSASHE